MTLGRSTKGARSDRGGPTVEVAMDKLDARSTQADALVVFGATGDLAHKMTFPRSTP
jgi:hypothetical protein